MLKYDAVIFDLDDTLVLELDFIKSGFQAVAQWLKRNFRISAPKADQLLLDLYYQEKKGVFDRFLSLYNINEPGIVEEMVSVYKTHFPRLRFLPDAQFVVDTLKKRGSKLGIITDGDPVTQQNKIRAAQGDKYFDVIIFSDLYGIENRKPSPVPYLVCLNQLGITDYEKAVYVGDNLGKDFVTPNRLGMLTVQIIRKEGIYGALTNLPQEYHPQLKIVSLVKLLGNI